MKRLLKLSFVAVIASLPTYLTLVRISKAYNTDYLIVTLDVLTRYMIAIGVSIFITFVILSIWYKRNNIKTRNLILTDIFWFFGQGIVFVSITLIGWAFFVLPNMVNYNPLQTDVSHTVLFYISTLGAHISANWIDS